MTFRCVFLSLSFCGLFFGVKPSFAEDVPAQSRACGPPLRDVLDAAMHDADLNTDRAEALRRRIHLSAFVPTVEMGATRRVGSYIYDLAAAADTTSARVGYADGYALDARLIFHFERAVYASEEISLLREARWRSHERLRFAEMVSELYSEHEELLRDERYGLATQDDSSERRRTEAMLDMLTKERWRGRWQDCSDGTDPP